MKIVIPKEIIPDEQRIAIIPNVAAKPLGIEVPQPLMSWMLESEERGQKQTAYRILAATGPERLIYFPNIISNVDYVK